MPFLKAPLPFRSTSISYFQKQGSQNHVTADQMPLKIKVIQIYYLIHISVCSV